MAEIEKRQIELLAPAGSYEIFSAVLKAGADAVYLGGSRFGARAYANNFSEEELKRAIEEAHIHGRQLYLTVNTLFKEEELEGELYDYLLPYYEQGLDAVIVQDIGAIRFIRQAFPGLDIHTSTQMTVTNRYGAELMKELGANRVVTAREMSFEEIRDIHDHVEVEIESFVHGALCYCYSGQCLLSSMLGGRSGNRGRCAQPCRLPYEVCDGKKKAISDRKGRKLKENYILSPKDMCTIELLPELVESGVSSFKIEGRMKQAEYAAGVVSVYRSYADKYLADLERFGDAERAKDNYRVSEEDNRKLFDFGNRSGFTEGYYRQHNGRDMITFEKPNHAKGNETLQEEIRQNYVRTQIKEKIKGNLRLSKEFPAKIEVSYGDISVRAEGEIPQAAQKQPLTREKVEGSLRKTGNTPYEFSELEIEMEDDLFLPMQALNQLRREVLDKLSEELTKRYRRNQLETGKIVCQENLRAAQNVVFQKANPTITMEPGEQNLMAETAASKRENPASFSKTGTQKQAAEAADSKKTNLAVSVETREQLSVVCSFPQADDIYIDSSCYPEKNSIQRLAEDIQNVHASGKRAFYILPAVFRKDTMEKYKKEAEVWLNSGIDGFVVKSLDELQFVRKEFLRDTEIIFDHNMYTYNNRAKALLKQFAPLRDTIPLELNRKELANRENRGSELLIYGNLPLMTSAQCVHANMQGCDRQPQVMYLKDRYGKYFPVKNNCRECYNVIYNTAPLLLFDYRKELEKMNITSYRISFTTEGEKEIKNIMGLYDTVFLAGKKTVREAYDGEYTNGHYKRGVE